MTPEISVAAPVFNESEGISAFVEETCRTLDWLGRRYELLYVDDGSIDDTRTKLLALAAQFPCLRPLGLDGHRGQSAAMAAAIAASQGLFISLIDADLQNDPADLGDAAGAARGRPAAVRLCGRRSHRAPGSLASTDLFTYR